MLAGRSKPREHLLKAERLPGGWASGPCCVLGGAHASRGPPLGPGSLHCDGKGSFQFPVTKISNCMCIWVPSLLIGSLDSVAQSAFPPSRQLASANALVLLGLCDYHLASNTEEGKEAKPSHMTWR